MDGFAVDTGALERAAAGIDDILDDAAEHQVSGLRCDQAVVGDAGLAGALQDFCSRWQRGISNLTRDGREIAARLAACAETYRRAGQDTRDKIINGIVYGPGQDTAARS
jgi:hypothetical protein